MAGGVIRQPAYRKVILDGLRAAGVEFDINVVVDDVAGQGALGLVERAKAES